MINNKQITGDKSNRITASLRLKELLCHLAFLGMSLFVSLFPSASSYPNRLALPQMLLQWGRTTFTSVAVKYCIENVSQSLKICMAEENYKGRLSLTRGDRTLEIWEERQEPWEAIEGWREIAPPSFEQWTGGFSPPKAIIRQRSASPPALSSSLLLIHLPSCTCLRALSIRRKKLDGQLIDINGKAHRFTQVTALWLSQPTLLAL